MSLRENEKFLDYAYEYYLEKGYSEEEAQEQALKDFEQHDSPHVVFKRNK